MTEKKILMTIRVFPKDDQVSLDELLAAVRNAFPNEKVSNSRKEPVAYGIEALIFDITAPEREGISELYENKIKGIKGVGEISVESERRFMEIGKPK